MRLGTVRAGGRDGSLVVVSHDGGRFVPAAPIASTLQAALDDWATVERPLRDLADRLDRRAIDGHATATADFLAPLPRAFEWLDGSAFLSHVRLARRARGAEIPPDLTTSPLMYQGGSGVLLGPHAPLPFGHPDLGLDFEAELAVITGDVIAGITPERASTSVRLVALINDVSLRGLVPGELAKGFGFVQSKPATAFAPFVVTPDELGSAWRAGRVDLPVQCQRNGHTVGRASAGEMHFSFYDLIAHAARTRSLTAGTIIGSGTIANEDPTPGVSCLVEARMREQIVEGSPRTEYLRPGEVISIEVHDRTGRSVFGRIEQEVFAP
ncbi:MAG TPA: fumarylacetoacetate hydrolase family protein [Polyangia bacterium]